MDWKDIASEFAKIGLPVLGGAIGGPGGASLGSMIASALGCGNSPSEVQQALLTSPDAAVKLKDIEAKVQIAQITAAAQQVESVNKTMQSEAENSDKENWWQKGWRPLNGYVVGLASGFAVMFICYLCYLGVIAHDVGALGAIPAVAMAITGILAVPGAAVGITAWHRGVGQVEQIKQQSNQ